MAAFISSNDNMHNSWLYSYILQGRNGNERGNNSTVEQNDQEELEREEEGMIKLYV